MTEELAILTLSAATIGFLHTLFGPDHYLPFIAMAKAGKWSIKKTSIITFLCGIGHVGGSILLGAIGVAFGLSISSLEVIEGSRGDIAAYLLIAFGLVYLVWGLRRAAKNAPHVHWHSHEGGVVHSHTHVHQQEHAHAHEAEKASITPWVLFTIFVFGPCEALIPLLMYPAVKISMDGMLLVVAVFGAATIGTMMTLVLGSLYGLSFVSSMRFERYGHAAAGATVCLCGVGIAFLGL